jgi:inner membrane protease subunit 2
VRDTYISYDKVTGASMAPTMNPHTHETGQRDWIFVRPFVWRMAKAGYDVQRGDVVTFWKPQKPEEMGIKRVIAVEGDKVWPRTGYVLEAEDKGKYLGGMPDGLADGDEDSIASERREKGVVVVPYGHVWVEGDNWRESWDSRHYGPISKGLLLGKAVGIWRGWGEFMGVHDEREKKEKKMASQVVEGKMEAPQVFLE